MVSRVALWTAAVLVLAFLVLPILVIVPLSFTSSTFLTFPIPGWSTQWYRELAASEPWRLSIGNSIVVAVIATVLATVLGTLAAVGLNRVDFRGKSLLMGFLISPMIVPLIIVAAGSYFFLAPIGLTNSLFGLALVHTALGAPFVLITVSATLAGFDPALARAASSLGAPPTTVFFKVILPLVSPGVVSGALMAFVTSFDEVVVAIFLTGPGTKTLPRQMFEGIRENISPTILAAATLLIALAILLLVTAELARRRAATARAAA